MSFIAIGDRSRLRHVLAGGASALAVASWAAPALAQDGTPSTASEQIAQEAAGEATIVVTGSRIVVPSGMDTPVPVTAVGTEELDSMDPGSLINSVSQLPQFYANQTPASSNFFTRGGTGNLNLRGLGVNRTLTLLNGRRLPSSSAFGGVDINILPEAAISGIEVVTGGASAAYGTDAVAGVTNFLLNTNFSGVEIELQGGMREDGDAENYEGKVIYGTNIGSRGHLIVSAERAEQNGIHSYGELDWYRSQAALNVGNVYRDYENVRSANNTRDGVIFAPGTSINGMQFTPGGSVAPFDTGDLLVGTVGAPGAATVNGDGDDMLLENFSVLPDTDRYSLFAYGEYEATDNISLFAQYIRGYNHQWQYATPNVFIGGIPTAVTIYQDNAFLPDSLRQTMIDQGIASFLLRRNGAPEDLAQAYYEDWTTQNIGTLGFNARVDNDGFFDGWNVQGYYQYGHSKRKWDQYGLRVDRIFAAVDAVEDPTTGEIVCRVSQFGDAFPGCQPLNLFGRGNASEEAIDYVLGNDVGEQIDTPLFFAGSGFDLGLSDSYRATQAKRNITTFKQHFAEVSTSGTVFDNWAGPVSLALGASYREESIFQIVRDSTNRSSNHETGRPVLCSGQAPGLRGVSNDCTNTVGIQYSKVSNISGSAKVKEAFAETLFPLISEQPWMQAATLSAAGRWADYSGSGTIWAYKFGLDMTIVDAIRLRGTYSRDVRAANLSERFDKTGGAGSVDDPRTPTVEAIPVTIFSGGNPNLDPEKADTFTAGVVLQPDFLPGFSASVDWYQVKIEDAIGTVGTAEVLRRCLIDSDPTFCELVTLDGAGVPILVGNTYVNVAQAKVEGIDAELSLNRSVTLFGGGDESLGARIFSSYLLERSDRGAPTAAAPTGAVTEFDGLTGVSPVTGAVGLFPKFKATGNLSYRNGGFSTFLQARLIGKGSRTFTPPAGVTIADNSVPAVVYVDLRLGYEFDIGATNLEVFANVSNLLDKDPPITGYFASFGGLGTPTNASLFDVLGRRYTVGVKLRM